MGKKKERKQFQTVSDIGKNDLEMNTFVLTRVIKPQ